LVDHSVKGCDGVLRDFSENDVTIGGSLADVFLWNSVGIGCSNKVDTLANKLVFLTVRDDEFFWASVLFDDLALFTSLVWGLVEDEDSRWSFTLLDAFQVGEYDTQAAFAPPFTQLWEDFQKGEGPSRIFVFYQTPYKTGE
jgi:hypothetical protein